MLWSPAACFDTRARSEHQGCSQYMPYNLKAEQVRHEKLILRPCKSVSLLKLAGEILMGGGV